jgi:hypothetical protein
MIPKALTGRDNVTVVLQLQSLAVLGGPSVRRLPTLVAPWLPYSTVKPDLNCKINGHLCGCAGHHRREYHK